MKYKKRAVVLIFGLVVLSFHANGQTEVDSSRVIRVLTFNILHGATVNNDFDLDRIARVINSTNPDIVALQEVDFYTNRARKMDLVTELAMRTKLAPLFGRAMPYDGGEYGEGILSRYSFLSTKTHALRYREGHEPRAALEANIILQSGDTIQFIGTHLDHTKDETNRMMQVEDINTIFNEKAKLSILAGDLNATPNSKPMKELFKIWTKSDEADEPTIPSNNPKKKIDYILYKPVHRWRVLKTKVIDEKIASDHLAMLSILEVLPKK
ncbi:MAG: endonuclease/exonuclease/phosphatase family protein [Cyclobacteriaceae bacterium]